MDSDFCWAVHPAQRAERSGEFIICQHTHTHAHCRLAELNTLLVAHSLALRLAVAVAAFL